MNESSGQRQKDPVRILIADDHEIVRQGMRSLFSLRGDWEICGEAVDGIDAVAKAKQLKPDVILLDITMPQLNGLEAARVIHREVPQSKIIVVSQHDPAHMRSRALEMGAQGYVAKSDLSRDLLTAVEAVIPRLRAPARPLSDQSSVVFNQEHEVSAEIPKDTPESTLNGAHEELEKRVKERTAELERAQESLRTLSGRLLEAQDEERRRIARELHDSAGQILTALKMNLAPVEDHLEARHSSLVKPVQDSLKLIDELSKELRTMSYLLHPPLLDEAGLPSAIRWYVEGFAERSKIRVSLDVAQDLGRLSSDLETTIFRIVQEGLTNIHRHSGSATASICVSRARRAVKVEISDHGKGMPASEHGTSTGVTKLGVGIQGMRERVRQLGGEFEIVSGSNGTSVIATLPERLVL
jgi:signal transduction histidine kinase